MNWSLVSGADFRRAIDWARKQPRLRDQIFSTMNYTKDQITAAINAAELVASETLADNHPVAITNATLLALIAGAKNEQAGDFAIELSEFEDSVDSALRNLRRAIQ